MNIKLSPTIIVIIATQLLFHFTLNAQTGPGGVGNSTGTSGQPKNILWLDVSQLSYSNNDDIIIWDDISGNNNDLEQSNSSFTPIFKTNQINSYPAAEFSKDNNRIVLNPFVDMPTNAITTFIIYKTDDSGDGLISYNTATQDNAFLLYDNNSFTTYINGNNEDSGQDFGGDTWQFLSHKWKSSGGTLIINKNGDNVHSSSLNNGASISTNGSLAIGGEQDSPNGGYDAGQDFDGNIAEIIFYNSFLNSAQRIIVENYLSEKYNLTFATASNDKLTGNNASYIYNIAGIGQETDGDHNLASSEGLYVHTRNSSFDNGEYIMFAHDNTTNNSSTFYTGVNLPAGTEAAWARDWYIEKTVSDGVDTKIIFDFQEGLTDGKYPSNVTNYVLLYRPGTSGPYTKVTVASQGLRDADQVYFDVDNANLQDGYYTIGTDDQTNSPLQGVDSRTWYTLASGNWDDWQIWTLDPSGAISVNEAHETPADIDEVVILTGKTVTISTNSKTLSGITVNGSLQLGTTSGHNFTEINGSGRIKLKGDNFPLGNPAHFVTEGQGEGTVVWQGGSFNLNTAHTFYNMEVELDDPANTITLLKDYTINGYLNVNTGELKINNNSATTNLNILVDKDVVIENDGKILTGTANARHQFNFYGDLINNGTLKFTNRVAPDYNNEANNGIVDANFLNSSKNQTIECNGISNFYRIEIDKGIDATYILDILSTDAANFNLYGFAHDNHSSVAQLANNDNSVGLIKGTVRLNDNVDVPVLNNNGNYNISEAARLWINGGSAAKNNGTAIVPYGKLKVTDGVLQAKVQSGITIRENGLIKIEGGTITTNQIRTSVFGAAHVGGYVQSGGEVHILGGNTNTDYYCFNLTFGGNVFNMSGGTLHIHEAHGKGGIFIASDETDYNVTGGTVIMEIDDGNDFEITSTAPFWNVIIRNSNSGNGKHILTDGEDVGATNVDLAAQNLVVLNDLTIETGTTRSETAGGESNTYGSYLNLVPDNTNPADLYVGRNLTIEDNAVLDVWGWTGADNSTSATVYFNSSKDAVFFIGNITTYSNALLEYESPNISDGGPDGNFPSAGTGEMHTWKYNLPLYNLIVDKPDATLSLAANSPGKGGNWGNAAGHAGNWVLSNGGKNTRRWLSQLLSIKNQFKLLNGTFSQMDPYNNVTIVENGGGTFGSVGDPVGYSVNFYTTDVEINDTMFVYEEGTTPKEGIIEVRAPNPLTLQTTDDAFIGNMRFIDDHNNPVTLVSDVHFGRIEYFNGTIDISTHNLKIDLFETYAVTNAIRMDGVSSGQPVFDAPNFIRMAGNVSDGGLSLKVPKNPTWPLPDRDEFEYLLNSWDEEQGPYAYPDRLWFPIGTDASGSDKYTPAVCRLQDYGTTDGDEYITVRVVDQELQTTDLSGGDILSYYWNVDFEGYANGEEPTVSWIFQYDDADLDVGAGDETQFVPGKVLDGGAYTRSDEGGTAAVKNGGASTIEGNILGNNPANIIIFNGTGTSGSTDPDDDIESISSRMFNTDATGPNINSNWQNAWPNTGFTLENANYTAGEAGRFVGTPEVYYTRKTENGDQNWSSQSTWSTVDVQGAQASSMPGAGDIVIIGAHNGTDLGYSQNPIRLDVDINTSVAKLEFEEAESGESRGRVFPQSGTSHDWNVVSGNGEIQLFFSNSGNVPTWNNSNDFGEFLTNTNSTWNLAHEGGSGTANAVTMPDFPLEFPNLRITATGGNNGGTDGWGNQRIITFPDAIQVNNELQIANRAALWVQYDIAIADELKVGVGYGHGRLRFANSNTPYTVTVAKNVLVGGTTGGQKENSYIDIEQSGTGTATHKLIVGGNITLTENGNGTDGYLDLFTTNTDDSDVILKLNSTGSSSLDNLTNITPDLYRIIMNKGTDTTSSFTFNSDFTLNGQTSGIGVEKAIKLQNGKLIFNHNSINVDLTTGDDDFYIPGTAGLEVRQGQANCSGNSGILLDGKLQISGGTVDMNGGDNYIQYSASGNSTIEISDGQLIVGGQIRRGLASSEGILNYQQSGGILIVGENSASEDDRGVFEILNEGSNFTFTDGTIYIGRSQNNPTIAALYLDPETYNLNNNSEIKIGYTSTPASQEIGIYSNIPIPNLTVDNSSTNNPRALMWVVPLTVSNLLDIENNTEFDANGLNLYVSGDFRNNGTFIPNQNNTYFNGSSEQNIYGETVFYNFYKNTSNTVNINDDITVLNEFHLLDGTLADNGNEIYTYGDLFNYGIHDWGDSGDGICIFGTEQQEMNTSGIWGKITINNPEGLLVKTAIPTIEIDDAVKMVNGVFNVGKNLLDLDEDAIFIEGAAYSENNMVQTNISFTDNGIRKAFPNGYNGIFTYPIGSQGKYTPVEFNIISTDEGTIRVRAANERHPTIQEDNEPCNEIVDIDNVLQYHWLVEAKDLTNFSANATMLYYDEDVSVTAPYDKTDYITAKLLLGTTSWNKYYHADFDETNNLLNFSFANTDDYGISGDYTAGVEDPEGNCEGAIPDEIPIYISQTDGDWTNKNNWDTHPTPGGIVPAGGPRGAVVIIRAQDEIVMPNNFITNYKTTINGVLNLENTFGHRLGYVDGTGEIYAQRGDLPGAIYDDFILPNTGTFHFGGNSDYSILSEMPIVNNLKFSGTGKRELPNLNIRLEGTLVIDGTDNSLQIINDYDRKIEVRNNITFNNGSFDAGTGNDAIFEIGGSNHQTISGTGEFTGSNAFNHFIMNNPDGLTIEKPVEIDETLDFDEGIIYNDGINYLTLNSTDPNVVIDAGTNNYVDGILCKNINTTYNNFIFPVGKSGRYGKIELNNANTGIFSTGYFYAEYFNHNPDDDGYDPESFASPLEFVSKNEYWWLTGPAGSNAYIKLRWDDLSGASSDPDERDDLRIAEWSSANSQWEQAHSNETASGTQNSGTITTANTSVSLNNNNYFTLASVTLFDNIWTGNSSTVWDNTTNWSNAKVPTSAANAIIPTTPDGGIFPEIDINAYCMNLNIESGAKVTIEPGGALTLMGKFNNDGTLIIESPNNSGVSGSFIDNGTITGTGIVKVERYFTGNEFHYVSTPVSTGDETSALFTRSNPSGNYNPNFYKYDETFDLDGNPNTAPAMPFDVDNLVPGWYYAHNGESGADIDLEEKIGYAFYTNANQMITFEGTLNTGNMDISGLTYTENDQVDDNPVTDIPELYDGWNLVGNPYPSSIDWDVIKNDLTNLDEGIYVWDGTQYANYVNGISSGSGNLSNNIPPMQAFYVHAKADGGGFSLNNSHRTHSNQEYLKENGKNKKQVDDLVKLKIEANGYTDVANVYFDDNATTNYDGNYDGLCLFAQLNDVPNLFTIVDNDLRLVTNAMPKSKMDSTCLPVGLRLYSNGTYTIYFDEINGFKNTQIFFEDTYNDKIIDIRQNNSYTFNHNSGLINDRFILRFFKNSPPKIVYELNDKKAFEDEQTLYKLSKNHFIDIDKFDSLRFDVKLSDGSNLPDWISFNNNEMLLKVIPTNNNVGVHQLKFVATDNLGASAHIFFKLIVINTNDKPILINPVKDIVIAAYKNLNFLIPKNTFKDIDFNDSLTYKINLSTGNELPAWLSFNPNTKILYGIPTLIDTGKYELKITATDLSGANAYDYFNLTVISSTNLTEKNNKFQIYPNPSNGEFTIYSKKPKYDFEITDMSGKIIYKGYSVSDNTKVDLGNIPGGTYILKLYYSDKTIKSSKITIQ